MDVSEQNLDWLDLPQDDSQPEPEELTPMLGDLKPRDLVKSVVSVYKKLGGDAWLLKQAQEYPKEFLGMIKNIMPKNVDVNLDTDIHIHLGPREERSSIGVQKQQFQLESNRPPVLVSTDQNLGNILND